MIDNINSTNTITGRISKRGFTLIELVVVIGVIALLTSILIIGLGGSRVKFNLLIERAHIVEAIYRAKSLAIQTHLEPNLPEICGYGVHFDLDSSSYFIYRDVNNVDPPEKPCDKTFQNEDYSADDGDLVVSSQVFALPARYVRFENDDPYNDCNVLLTDLFFGPPDPKVRFIGEDPNCFELRRVSGFVQIITVEAQPEKWEICVSKEGAVSYALDKCVTTPL